MHIASRVLLIDDEPRVGDALRFALERHGVAVTQELTGADGQESARREPPDAILLDVGLSGEDGIDRLRALKADPETQSIPVIMLSGRVDAASIAIGLEAGAEDYITKPFTPAELRARISHHVRRRNG
ncbi:MAG: response regulator transcription factor [Candidatus Dormibacteria bacterium]